MNEYMNSDNEKQHFLNQRFGEKGFIEIGGELRLEFKILPGYFVLLKCGPVCYDFKKKWTGFVFIHCRGLIE